MFYTVVLPNVHQWYFKYFKYLLPVEFIVGVPTNFARIEATSDVTSLDEAQSEIYRIRPRTWWYQHRSYKLRNISHREEELLTVIWVQFTCCTKLFTRVTLVVVLFSTTLVVEEISCSGFSDALPRSMLSVFLWSIIQRGKWIG